MLPSIKLTLNLMIVLLSVVFSGASFSKDFIFNHSQLNLSPYFSIYEDPDSTMKAESVLTKNNLQNFTQLTQNPANFGYSRSSYWLTTSFQPLTTQQLFLEIANPRLDQIELYLYHQDTLIKQITTGNQTPFSTRPIDHHNFIFPLTLQAQQQYSILIRLKSTDNLLIPATLWTKMAFYRKQSETSLIFGFFYGTLVVMIIINMLVFITINDRKYLSLSLFLFFFSLSLFSLNGLSSRFLWGEWIWWSKQSLVFLEGAAIIFGLLFTRLFLNTQHFLPRLDKYLALLIPIAAITSVLAMSIDYYWSRQIISILIFIIPILTLLSAYRCWMHQYKPARYFLIAWFIFLFSLIAYGLMLQTILPCNIFTQYGMHAGLMWLAVMLSLALTDRFNLLKQQKELAQLTTINYQKQVMKSISRFVPTQFLNLLGKVEITDIKYGDAVLKNMFIMFTDIRGFTSLSESMSPKENLNFLNSYMKFMQPVIEKNQGFIDKFIGDAIMALFPDTADQAVQAAIEMQQQLHLFNTQLQAQGYDSIEFGIGIHGGDVMLGTVGSDARLETTVIGDAVNLTSRLESLTKERQVSIIISEQTFNALKKPALFTVRLLDKVSIRGKANQVKIYQVIVPDA